MTRQEVVDALEEIGLLLELLGENPFKSRAYENAARIVQGLDRDLEDVVRSGEIRALRGIGSALADKISTLVIEGRLPYLDTLRSKVPSGLRDWLAIPGLGPKKARLLHVSLGISTLEELDAACEAGRVREIDGFGPTSERKIREGIARVRSSAGRFLHPVARTEAERLRGFLRAVPGVERVEIAGSVRRRAETSKDIDIVVSAAEPDAVMEAFASAPEVQAVTGRGPTKCSVRLASGPSADLRVVPGRSFPCALLYFTGSKAHNIALRARAQKNGLRLNEYALAREDDGEEIACADEEEVYRALGLTWIPPELREDGGEIEAAEAGSLPRLLTEEDLAGILHCHTTWSDGTETIREMAAAARRLGVSYLGVCDHSRSAAYAGGMSMERVHEQHDEIDRLNREYDGAFRVLKGIEVDILADGTLDYPDEVLSGFELVIASVHSHFTLSAEDQTRRFLRALENPWVDVLGHPTGRLLLARDGYPLDLERVLDAAAERSVAVEVNSHPQRLDLDWQSLRYGLGRGLKTAINPDAHSPEGIADVIYGVGVARKAWCGPDDVLNTLPVEKLLEHLRAKRRDRGAGQA